MKIIKEKEELKNLSSAELQVKLETLRRTLFSLRLNAATAHIKDYSQFKKLRASVARALTCMRQQTGV